MLHVGTWNTKKSAKSDFVGMLISSLCLIHCLATPFLFIAKTCSATCCSETPVWWKTIDFLFLGISFFAVFESTRKTSKQYMKFALWLTWLCLSVVLVNEYVQFFTLFKQAIFIPAIVLISLHLYNWKYCQCKANCC